MHDINGINAADFFQKNVTKTSNCPVYHKFLNSEKTCKEIPYIIPISSVHWNLHTPNKLNLINPLPSAEIAKINATSA